MNETDAPSHLIDLWHMRQAEQRHKPTLFLCDYGSWQPKRQVIFGRLEMETLKSAKSALTTPSFSGYNFMTISLKQEACVQSTHRTPSALLRATMLAVSTLLFLSACAGNDPLAEEGSGLAMVPVNHTDRYAMNVFVGKSWAGDIDEHSGGGAAACCYFGPSDWRQPVTVRWTWGEDDAKDGKPAVSEIKRAVVTHFPASGPRSDPDPSKDDAYVCVILRDLDTVELAFSPSASRCATK